MFKFQSQFWSFGPGHPGPGKIGLLVPGPSEIGILCPGPGKLKFSVPVPVKIKFSVAVPVRHEIMSRSIAGLSTFNIL